MKKYLLSAICVIALVFAGCEQNGPSDDKGSSLNNSYILTGEAKDVTSNSVVVYGEVKVNIADYDAVEYGVLCSVNKNEVESRSASKKWSSVDLQDEEFLVSLSGLPSETKFYYCAFVYLNEKQYKYGEIKSFTTLAGGPKSVFSVSESKRVTFSPGNLQYTQSTDTWSFASAQYEVIGTDNVVGSALADKVDLFGRSRSTTNFGVNTSKYIDDKDFYVDWGVNKIGNDAPNTWRTLTYDEWEYLLTVRPNASSLCGVAQVNGVNGLIFLQDYWKCPEGITFKSGLHSDEGVDYYAAYQTFTADQWSKLESAGAIFLPAAGCRFGTTIYDVQYYGNYWATYNSRYGNSLHKFVSNGAFVTYYDVAGDGYNHGYSVRLVKDLN